MIEEKIDNVILPDGSGKDLKCGRRDHLRKIELSLQEEWKNNEIFKVEADINWDSKMTFEEKNKTKFLVTFPYPYVNGKLHLGHAFSMSKCEFQARYQRLIGKNSMFPFAFHCTGMPIAAAANKVKAELIKYNSDIDEILKDSKTQISILVKMGIDRSILTKFADPVFWLEYFPPIGRQDLESLGVSCDFSRSFITTERQIYYDKFINWHFNKLKNAGVIKFGKRYTIYSKSDDQPCADHDRSEGEGVGVQEYTLVKMKVVGGKMPEKLLELINKKNCYLVAATLRPETMYGQTNAFVLPSGEYGVYENKVGEYLVCSHHSAVSMSYQELLEKKASPVLTFKGQDIVGMKIKAPLSVYPEIYVIPLLTISMNKGTGVVISVPSDAPDDYIALKDFKNDEKLRKTYEVLPEMVEPFNPVKIINIPEISDLSAVDLCEERKVKDQHDKEKLKEIKDLVYLKGFNTGTMLIGKYKGESVEAAKKKVKKDLVESGEGLIYCEPESLVKTRTGEVAIVALVDQWMICYGEEEWQKVIHEHLNSPLFKSYNPNTFKEMINKVGWLKEWGCSRVFGLGSRLPWDKQYLIESLSDSTIYMAFYTICKYFSKDMYGDVPVMKPEYVDDVLFDYVFLGIESPQLFKNLDRNLCEQMRKEFLYWYPMDLRCSGKDLIPNHLTMCLYNHAFVWNQKDLLPRSIFTNGHILYNNEPMSKSKGTFKTISDIVTEYGADASRLALADCGDGNDDANFLTELANSNINRLYSFENFIKKLLKEANWNDFDFQDIDNLKFENKFDIIFDNNINYLVYKTKNAYEEMKYKEVLKYGFYEMLNIKDQYILYNESDHSKLNNNLMIKYLCIFLRIMNPIIPHWTEYIYKLYVNPYLKNENAKYICTYLAKSTFPKISSSINKQMYTYYKYMKTVITNIHDLINSKQKKTSKKDEMHCEIFDKASK